MPVCCQSLLPSQPHATIALCLYFFFFFQLYHPLPCHLILNLWFSSGSSSWWWAQWGNSAKSLTQGLPHPGSTQYVPGSDNMHTSGNEQTRRRLSQILTWLASGPLYTDHDRNVPIELNLCSKAVVLVWLTAGLRWQHHRQALSDSGLHQGITGCFTGLSSELLTQAVNQAESWQCLLSSPEGLAFFRESFSIPSSHTAL